MAATILWADPSPWTVTGANNISKFGNRRVKTSTISLTAAPVGEVTRPIRCGSLGKTFFRIASNNPSSSNLDFNNSFYSLSFFLENDDNKTETSSKNFQILSKIKSSDWYHKWRDRLSFENKNNKDIIKIILKNNPSIIPRNHLVEKILNKVIETNDRKILTNYLNELNKPKKIRSFDDPLTFVPSPNEEVTQTFCGT